MPREIPLATPGEILNEEWLKPLGISQYALAKAIRVSPRRINQIVHGKRAITADTALRLAAFLGLMHRVGLICKHITIPKWNEIYWQTCSRKSPVASPRHRALMPEE